MFAFIYFFFYSNNMEMALFSMISVVHFYHVVRNKLDVDALSKIIDSIQDDLIKVYSNQITINNKIDSNTEQTEVNENE